MANTWLEVAVLSLTGIQYQVAIQRAQRSKFAEPDVICVKHSHVPNCVDWEKF